MLALNKWKWTNWVCPHNVFYNVKHPCWNNMSSCFTGLADLLKKECSERKQSYFPIECRLCRTNCFLISQIFLSLHIDFRLQKALDPYFCFLYSIFALPLLIFWKVLVHLISMIICKNVCVNSGWPESRQTFNTDAHWITFGMAASIYGLDRTITGV